MSARYSSSPTLRLAIADSSRYRGLLLLLATAVLVSLVLICLRGYPGLALLLSPLAFVSLWRQYGQAPGGWVIYWRRGSWLLERGGTVCQMEVLPHSVCLSWVTCLVFTTTAGGRSRRAWIFNDACDGESLRRLRVRLTLQR